jgi:hypothetical protein
MTVSEDTGISTAATSGFDEPRRREADAGDVVQEEEGEVDPDDAHRAHRERGGEPERARARHDEQPTATTDDLDPDLVGHVARRQHGEGAGISSVS